MSIKMKLTEDVSSKMQKIVSTTRDAATTLDSLGRNIDRAFRSNAAAAFGSRTGEALRSVNDEAENLGETLEQVLRDFSPSNEDLTGDISGQLRDAADQADDLSDSAGDAGDSMDDLARRARDAGEGLDDLGDGGDGLDDLADDADSAGESLDDLNSRAGSLSGAIKGVIAAVAGLKVVGEIKDFIGDAVGIGKDFTSMMSEVQSISGASGSEIAKMEETARSYGATTVFSATEAAEALKYMSLAGWDANQSSSALGGVLNLAAASGMELGQASDMVTDYLSAFGMQAGQASYFADMLSYAQSKSNTTAAQLGEAYRNSAANMHAAGQDVETTTSFLEAMANQGYKGSEAGTALAATMRDITQKMEDGAVKIGETSVAVQDSKGNFRDLTDVMADVEKATGGMGDAQKAAALGSTFTADSIKAINMILAEGMDKVSGYEDALRSAGGTAEAMAGTMNDNLTGDMANMNSAFEEMKLQVFDRMEGTLRDGAQYVTGTVIPALTEWVPEAVGTVTAGVSAFASAVGPLFETVLKNPRAVVEAIGSITAGFAAFKAVTAGLKAAEFVKGAGGITSVLSKLGAGIFGNPWAAGAAAVTAAVAAIGFAVHEYNKLQIEDSLATHFGDIELSAEQVESAARHILNAKYLVNVEAALNEFQNADKLADEAQEALQKNDALEWKASIGMELDESEISEYVGNIDTFIQSRIGELESRTYAATITVQTMLSSSEEGQTLASQMEQWAVEDELEMNTLSQRLKSAVEKAMTDGVLDANEQAAITILQHKMNSILSSWKESDTQAGLDLIDQKYGSASGKDLTAKSFTKIVDELKKQRKDNQGNLDESYTDLMSTLHGLDNSGRLDEAGLSFDSLKTQAGYAYRNASASELAHSVDYETNTLSDTYGDLLDTNFSKMEKESQSFVENASSLFSQGDIMGAFDQLTSGANAAQTYSGLFSSRDQKALADIYESMQPDVEAMQSLMGEYRDAGQAIPQELMASFNKAMMVGAAAGDANAAFQVFANQMIADPANNAMVEAIQNGTQAAPQELKDALGIALAEQTSEPLAMEEVAVSLAGVDLDVSQVAELTDFSEEEVQAILDKMNIEAAAEVDVKTEAGTVDGVGGEQAGQKAEEAVKASAGGEAVEVEKSVNVKTKAGENDQSGAIEAGKKAGETAQSAAGSDTTVEQTVKTNKKYVPGDEDTSQVTAATEQALSQQTIDSKATVDVTAQPGTDNFTETAGNLASKFGAAVKAAFAKTFTAATNVSITANYSLANPTKTISFSGGGSGTATVKASMHASGGIFHEPHLGMVAEAGYPESIIPIDGSQNAIGLWQKTGEMLGLGSFGQEVGGARLSGQEAGGTYLTGQEQAGQRITTMPSGMGMGTQDRGQTDKASAGGDRNINLNINGSGKIQVTSNMSKDDVVRIILDNAKEVIYQIVEQETMEEGDLVYDY